jgi:hypothetical protein
MVRSGACAAQTEVQRCAHAPDCEHLHAMTRVLWVRFNHERACNEHNRECRKSNTHPKRAWACWRAPCERVRASGGVSDREKERERDHATSS